MSATAGAADAAVPENTGAECAAGAPGTIGGASTTEAGVGISIVTGTAADVIGAIGVGAGAAIGVAATGIWAIGAGAGDATLPPSRLVRMAVPSRSALSRMF